MSMICILLHSAHLNTHIFWNDKSPQFNHNVSDDGAELGKLGQWLTWAPPGQGIADTQNYLPTFGDVWNEK